MPNVIATAKAMRSLLIEATYPRPTKYRYGDSNPGFRTENRKTPE
jgi:hypothetical protein